ncbi:RibD family protein [Sciscionella marina]|uniref:RibD family protein n=1 Tax=Sciscionella marina TaxID=508770 RepID=UPI00037C2B7A|nr:dihydrofolate reductase family protein [Sciscionella marina]
MKRPHVLASVATSLDGYIDDTSPQRLVLSTEEDFARVHEVRASVDAILVGAGTVRADDPRLRARGARRQPVKVILSSSGALDPGARVFAEGRTLVYTTRPAPELEEVATVVVLGEPGIPAVLADLSARGVGRLMVEGGGQVHTAFLVAGVVDELQLVLAPFFLGKAGSARFVHPAEFDRTPLVLAETRRMGDLVLLRYTKGEGA